MLGQARGAPYKITDPIRTGGTVPSRRPRRQESQHRCNRKCPKHHLQEPHLPSPVVSGRSLGRPPVPDRYLLPNPGKYGLMPGKLALDTSTLWALNAALRLNNCRLQAGNRGFTAFYALLSDSGWKVPASHGAPISNHCMPRIEDS